MNALLVSLLILIFGILLLIIGARLLVYGASQIAGYFKIPYILIGLSVVAFGTSAPEIGVSVAGALKGEGGLVIGNLVGSNILNILLVLGLSAVFNPLVVQRRLIRIDIPLMILVSAIFWFLSWLGPINRWEGIFLFLTLIAYLFHMQYMLKNEKKQNQSAQPQPILGDFKKISLLKSTSLWLQIVWIILSLGMLGWGSDISIKSAVKIANYYQVDPLLIGLTILALGTSLPEVAVSISAAIKKEPDIAVGNIVGSNIFNILGVLGIASILSPTPIVVPKAAIQFDLPIMTAVAVASLPILLTGHKISRWEGFLFLFYYILYVLYLFYFAKSHRVNELFSIAFFFFILPLTIITLAIGLIRHYQKRNI